LLIVDALRERSRGPGDAPQRDAATDVDTGEEFDAEYPDEPAADTHDDAETTSAPTEHVEGEVTEEERPR
jgi:hypothetical protein